MPNVETALTNDILEIESVLGIEAAQRSIINEIVFTLKSHGIEINVEHITLLADLMCFKGKVNGITRFGIKNFKSSPLMLASFEQTGEHLFDAAANNKCNTISGVSDAIIVGGKIPVGTGDVSIYYNDKQRN
ncbi:RNA polymerase III, large subunit [Trachipleistophora hominis]|uniref:DNA-directed RNA polymerase n=1 Tax=Trachipleistophora hominis TaxID=72359 RepID=L7JZK3_TRAHO|nr:RNA polymerase III, large subunit [Trachipleistophora hominis]